MHFLKNMPKKRKKKKKQIFSGPIPEVFFARLTAMFGSVLAEELTQSFIYRPTTFRINPFISSEEEVLGILTTEGFELDTVPWIDGAYILRNKEKADICDLTVYTDNMIYLQSLASMVPPIVLDPLPGERVLDLTAAPGSKTSQIAAMMHQSGELVANDKNKIRFFKLKHNMESLGVTGQNATPPQSSPYKGEGATWNLKLRMEPGTKLTEEYPEYFDKILLDAPCSSEARFVEGKPKTYGYWKERKINEMAYTQQKLLFAAWKALKPGGTLVYSTCTFAPEENEMQISALLDRVRDAEILPVVIEGLESLPILTEWNSTSIREEVQHCLRVKPTADIEGFFIAKVVKIG